VWGSVHENYGIANAHAARADHSRTVAHRVVVFADDVTQDIELSFELVGLRPRRHHAALAASQDDDLDGTHPHSPSR
jgi:hypothetical protein